MPSRAREHKKGNPIWSSDRRAIQLNGLQHDQRIARDNAMFWISAHFTIRISPSVMLSEAKHL